MASPVLDGLLGGISAYTTRSIERLDDHARPGSATGFRIIRHQSETCIETWWGKMVHIPPNISCTNTARFCFPRTITEEELDGQIEIIRKMKQALRTADAGTIEEWEKAGKVIVETVAFTCPFTEEHLDACLNNRKKMKEEVKRMRKDAGSRMFWDF